MALSVMFRTGLAFSHLSWRSARGAGLGGFDSHHGFTRVLEKADSARRRAGGAEMAGLYHSREEQQVAQRRARSAIRSDQSRIALPRRFLSGVSTILFVASFVVLPTQVARATVRDGCITNFPGQNEVVPCIGVNGSGDWVNYVDVGAKKLVTPTQYQWGYVQVGWFYPNVTLTQTNFHVWATTLSTNFWWYLGCGPVEYWWQQQGGSWKAPCSNQPNHTYGWWVNNYVGSKDRICTRTWVRQPNGSYYGSYFDCVTITP